MESAEKRMIKFQSPLLNLRVPFCLQRALDASSPILAGLESFATMVQNAAGSNSHPWDNSFLCIFILTQHGALTYVKTDVTSTTIHECVRSSMWPGWRTGMVQGSHYYGEQHRYLRRSVGHGFIGHGFIMIYVFKMGGRSWAWSTYPFRLQNSSV